MRAGTAKSPFETSLFWMGDQLPTFDSYDGILSALIGQLNGGISGFHLTHSDIGGYTNTKNISGVDYLRTEFFMLRWIEMSAFSDIVMRSHPSNMPETVQLWSSPRIILHLKKFVDIHVALSSYKKTLA